MYLTADKASVQKAIDEIISFSYQYLFLLHLFK